MRTLEVIGVRLFPKEDGAKHHTERYQLSQGTCILRRGQLFHCAISFNGTYDPRVHRVRLEFSTGPDRRFETFVSLRVREAVEDRYPWPPGSGDWAARRAHNRHDTAIAVGVYSPVWIPVCRWQLRVRTELLQAPRLHSSVYTYPGHLYFLFNPWHNEDDTYFEDSSLLEEYILNDIGHVWTENEPPRLWEYGQFEECVLPALDLALDNDRMLPHYRRGDPVQMSRAISRIVNSNGNGIVVGRWVAPYDDGKAPVDWTGSVDILQNYLNSSGQPVKYGQCWVFAGVAATICRALGIPCRLVTNWVSAHDATVTNTALTLDVYYDQNLEKVDYSESIWNFHCWVDVWMRRPDLRQPEYDGWQTIDGTPQELSRGQYQLGPAPVSAILSGDTQVPYDVPFVFTEVNGDSVRWWQTPDGRMRLIDVEENLIGRALLTDHPLSSNKPRPIDITDQYKPPEGTPAERRAVLTAFSTLNHAHVTRRRRALDEQRVNNDVAFKAHSPNVIDFGEDFDLALDMINKSSQDRTVTSELILDLVNHMGKQIDFIKTSGQWSLKLSAHEDQTRHMFISAREYAPKVTEDCYLRYRVKCWVKETDQAWLSNDYQESININAPVLKIDINEELHVGRPVWAYFSFDRSLMLPLTNCHIKLGGSALERADGTAIEVADVPAGQRFFARIRIQPVRAGHQKITAKFTSSEIPKAENWIHVEVKGEDGLPHLFRNMMNFDDNFDEIINNAFDNNIR